MFGMGTGIASPLWPPAFITRIIAVGERPFSAHIRFLQKRTDKVLKQKIKIWSSLTTY